MAPLAADRCESTSPRQGSYDEALLLHHAQGEKPFVRYEKPSPRASPTPSAARPSRRRPSSARSSERSPSPEAASPSERSSSPDASPDAAPAPTCYLEWLESLPKPDGRSVDLTQYRRELSQGRYPLGFTRALARLANRALILYVRHNYDVGRVARLIDRSRITTIRCINSELLLRKACARLDLPNPQPHERGPASARSRRVSRAPRATARIERGPSPKSDVAPTLLERLEAVPPPDGKRALVDGYRRHLSRGRYPPGLTRRVAWSMNRALAVYRLGDYNVDRVADLLGLRRNHAIRLINSELLLRTTCARLGALGPQPDEAR